MPGPSNHASKKKRKAAGTAQKHSKSSGVAGKTQGQQQRGQDAGGVSGMDSNHIASAIEGPSMDPAGSYTDDSSISANRPSTTSVKSVKSRLGTSGTGYGHDIHRHCHQHPPTSHRQSPPSRHAQDSHSRSHAHLLHSSSQSSSSSSTCPSHLLSYPYHQQQQQPQTVGIASSSFDAPSSSTFSSSLREMPPHAQISSPLSFAPLPPPPPAPKGSRSSGTIPRDNNSNSTGHGRTKTGSLDLSNSSSSPKRGRSLVRRRTTNSRHPQVPIEPSQFPSSSHHGQPSAPTSGMQQHEPGPSHGDWNMERKPLSVAITPLLVPHHHHRPRHNFLGVGTTGHGDRSKPSSSDSGSSPSTSQILTPSPPLDHSSLPSHAAADSEHVLMAESETDSYLDYDDEESAQLFGVRVLRVVRHESARVTHSSSQAENRNNRFGDHVVVESGYESMEVEKERKQRERQRTEQARVAERVRNGVQQQRQQEEEQQEQQGSEHQTISEPDEELQSQHQATEEQVESIVSSASLRALLWPDPMPPPMPWEDHTYQYYFDTSMEERTQLSLSSSNHHHHQPVYTSPSHSRSPSRTTSESYHSAYSRGDRPPSTSSSRSGSSEHDGRPRVYTHPDPDFVDAQYRSYSYPYSHSRSPSRVQSTTGRSRSRSLSYSRSPPQHHRPLSRPPSQTQTHSPTQSHSRSASSSTGTSDWFDTCDPNRSGPRSVNFNLVDETTEEEALDDWDKEIIDKITPCLHDPGNGVRVKDVKRFMDSYFAREPALDVCSLAFVRLDWIIS
ncbi:hypothetical protein BDN72DRAFT_310784 [Pluteus cervinus]|uniref:Uncharacterized protein n=1 Tax=Pluteus cervinus TaxID=181527 RepID=A0ACD3ACW5_9AGAR|nr:hypothetical protein BDN72DRAFT_310784 [Pluteus cervinus]